MRKPLISLLLLANSLIFAPTAFAAANTLTYTYDALGRLTYVQDNVNGNRDYDYDKAGNRLNVATAKASDPSSEPTPLPQPTGLYYWQVADCAYSASWGSVPYATDYIVGDTQGKAIRTPSLSQTIDCPTGNPYANRPKWVQACNFVGCSVKAYF